MLTDTCMAVFHKHPKILRMGVNRSLLDHLAATGR